MSKYVLTVTLNPAVDKILQVPNFRIGKDFREEKVSLNAGGKGINVSRVLKILGKKTLATGFLGGEEGDFFRKELTREKIAHDFLPIEGGTRTNLTILDSKAKKITRVLERGPAITTQETKAFKKKFERLLENCKFAIFSGSSACGLPASFYGELIALAKRNGIKTALDTSANALKEGFGAKPFLIKPNLEEAESIVGFRLNSLPKIRKALRYFHSSGIKVVLLSMGEKGAIASDGKEKFQAMAPSMTCLNSVGCGDALLAGFVFSYLLGQNLSSSLSFAVACGTANALSTQPGDIKRDIAKKFTTRIKIRELQ